jgi:hypothetical protein
MLVALSILLSFCVILYENKFHTSNDLFDEFGFVSVFQTILFSRFFCTEVGFPQPFQVFV